MHMEKEKLTISAKEVMDDLQAGMDDDAFMAKYSLTYRQLQRLYRKLINSGFISPTALAQRLCVTKSQVREAFLVIDKALKEKDRPQ